MFFKIKKKGQVSLELIILIGVLIVSAIVLSVILINSYNKSISSSNNTYQTQDDVIGSFVNDLNNLNSSNQKFKIVFVNPSSETIYNVKNKVPFLITYSNPAGNVTCNWVVKLTSVDSNPINLTGCSTSRVFSAGDYTVSYSVSDTVTRINGTSTFKVS